MKKIKYVMVVLCCFFISSFKIYAVTKVACGNITGIPQKIPELTSFVVNLIQIAVPIILVLMGSIDLFKGITASKEDEIKKGQSIFIKRLIIAAIIFFVVVIVKFIISLVADSTSGSNISQCIDCFVTNNCQDTTGRLVCNVDHYELLYNKDGTLFGWRDKNSSSGYNFTNKKNYYSAFKPTTGSECPTSANAAIMFEKNGTFIIIHPKQ